MSGWPMGKEGKIIFPYPFNLVSPFTLLIIGLILIGISTSISGYEGIKLTKKVVILEEIVYNETKIIKDLFEIVKLEKDMIGDLNQRIMILEKKVKNKIYYKPDYYRL